ncbi:MAG: type II toxin-antitoxin system RelE/ParE family toxin [Terriglobales bacterium]
MIRSFADAETERLWRTGRSKGLPGDLLGRAKRKLAILDGATDLRDLASPPGNRLERLHGGREGQHSIRINDQWRICFRWDNADALDVEVTDYH